MRLQLESSGKATDGRLLEMLRLQTEATESLRKTVDEKLTQIRQGNEKSLTEIRASVEEKLQNTLEDKISRSFKEVSDRLAEVYKGLGEMQTLASGVGDLKRVLSNVKTRGILGEIQLGSILEEILSPEQYETEIATIPGSQNRVEFAVRLPGGEDGGVVYLPVDSKFPMDAYLALQDAYDAGDPEAVASARKELETRVKSFAKDIHTKYIEVPHTTEFAIMFLPTEGLYAEVVRLGLVETLQSKYRVNVAGPTTMAALLNALQTGFRTLAIQKRSSQVWEILGAVRTEFDKFGSVIKKTQDRLNQANQELDELVGVRTRVIQRKLRGVSALPADRAETLLEGADDAEE
ncbi:MAG: DNA recombination protein RmuC [Clostridia bacterium]|nr:DNA recombination protein RmuC [Clostridia bacterium]